MFGWHERIRTLESSKFFCPTCRRDAPYSLLESRKWFKLFFLPVLPESRPLRFVRCDRCNGQFDERVLSTVVSAGIDAAAGEDAGEGAWPQGSRVLAVWPVEQVYWYPATVKASTARWVEVHYDDGHKARLKPSEVAELDITVGSRVFARFESGPYYYPAEVTQVNGERIRVAYEDGRTEMTTVSVIRVMRGPGSNIEWQYGDRVLAPYDAPFYYPATIAQLDNDKARVEYDDGDEAEMPTALLHPLQLAEGDRVYCRWRGGPHYFPGVIEEMGGEDIFVKYEDGRAEHTTIQMVRVIPDELPR
jgi:hypothetical protein